jgi:C_GCAxxG_C_C family probable redox protein
MNRTEKAVSKFKEGFNCAQSVLHSYADELGLSQDLATKIATGFGAGMGRKQEVCGAVTGALMVIGLMYGRGDGEGKEKQEITYSKVQFFIDSFINEFGTVNCKGLLDGCCLLTAEGQKAFKDNRLKERCYEYVRASCRILDQIRDADSEGRIS